MEALLRWLWPDAPTGSAGGPTVVVPARGTARCLVSVAPPRVMQRMLTGYNGIRTPRRARARTAAGLAVRAPLGRRLAVRTLPVVAEGDSFPAALAEVLDLPDARLVVAVRDTSDHHAKPTIQVFDSAGAARAYVKIGWTAATSALVSHEAAALRAVAETGLGAGVSAPSVLRAGRWRGEPFVVLSPLPTEIVSLPATWDPSSTARAVAGPLSGSALAQSGYARELARRLDALPPSSLGAAARTGLRHLTERGVARWRFGRTHGDFTRWNAGTDRGVVYLWDWEHALDEAPYGFDELHWYLTDAVQLRGEVLADRLDEARRRAAAGGSPEPELLVLAYLVEMAVRSCEVSGPSGHDPQPLLPGLPEALRAAARPAAHDQPSRRPR